VLLTPFFTNNSLILWISLNSARKRATIEVEIQTPIRYAQPRLRQIWLLLTTNIIARRPVEVKENARKLTWNPLNPPFQGDKYKNRVSYGSSTPTGLRCQRDKYKNPLFPPYQGDKCDNPCALRQVKGAPWRSPWRRTGPPEADKPSRGGQAGPRAARSGDLAGTKKIGAI